MKPRIAVLGCGYWGSNHIRTLKSLGALHAVSDANHARAEGFASEQDCLAILPEELVVARRHRRHRHGAAAAVPCRVRDQGGRERQGRAGRKADRADRRRRRACRGRGPRAQPHLHDRACAALPPGLREAQVADRQQRARRGQIHPFAPARPRQVPHRERRAVGPRAARPVDDPGDHRHRAGRGARRGCGAARSSQRLRASAHALSQRAAGAISSRRGSTLTASAG